MEHHLGRVFTVFSASNYCGNENNWGGVVLLTRDPHGCLNVVVREHNVSGLDALPAFAKIPEGPARDAACLDAGLLYVDSSRVAVGHRRVELALRQLAAFVLEKKTELFQAFHEVWSVTRLIT